MNRSPISRLADAAAVGALFFLRRAKRKRVAMIASKMRPAMIDPIIIPANAPFDIFEDDDGEFCAEA